MKHLLEFDLAMTKVDMYMYVSSRQWITTPVYVHEFSHLLCVVLIRCGGVSGRDW